MFVATIQATVMKVAIKASRTGEHKMVEWLNSAFVESTIAVLRLPTISTVEMNRTKTRSEVNCTQGQTKATAETENSRRHGGSR